MTTCNALLSLREIGLLHRHDKWWDTSLTPPGVTDAIHKCGMIEVRLRWDQIPVGTIIVGKSAFDEAAARQRVAQI